MNVFELPPLTAAITLDQILSYVKPGNAWGWIAVIVIVLDIFAMALQKKGSLLLTMCIAASILASFINVLGNSEQGVSGAISATQKGVFADMLQSGSVRFGNWMVGIVMFVGPLVFAGMTKTGRTRGPAILAGIFGMIYLFGRWFTMAK